MLVSCQDPGTAVGHPSWPLTGPQCTLKGIQGTVSGCDQPAGEWFERRMRTLWRIEVQGLQCQFRLALGVDQEGFIPSHVKR